MRRGLIAWSKAELPEAVFEARQARLRTAMAAAGLEALLVYTNNTRPAGVSWFTGFVPYWSEGLLLLPRTGAPCLVVALSNRVHQWIKATCHVGEVIGAPRLGLGAGKRMDAMAKNAAIGVADLSELPAGIARDLMEASPGATLVDATALVEALRGGADAAEIALAAKAGAIAQAALAQPSAQEREAGAVVAAVEAEARRRGAEEAYIAVAPDLAQDRRFRRLEAPLPPLGTRFALRATIAYKGTWVRMARTVVREAGDGLIGRAAERFAAAVAALPSAQGFGDFADWLVEGCRVAQPLAPLMGARVGEPAALRPGALLSVSASLALEGQAVLLAAPVLLGQEGAPAACLVAPDFMTAA